MSRCARQWRNLKQIKRGGGGHMETGLTSVPDGAFALECPACPHPGRNLPEDWDQAPESAQYVHMDFCPPTQNGLNRLSDGCTRTSLQSMPIST